MAENGPKAHVCSQVTPRPPSVDDWWRGNRTCDLIDRFSYLIEVFTISFSPQDFVPSQRPGDPEPDACDPRPLVCGFDKMEELHVRWPVFHSSNDNLAPWDVRTLSIEYHHQIDVVPLLESFRSIRNLIFYPSPRKWKEQARQTEFLDKTRDRNYDIQDEYGDTEILDLDYYGGDVLGLYALSPVGRIAHLDVRLPPDNWRCYEYLHDAIRQNRPSRVTIHYTVDWEYSWLCVVVPGSISQYVNHLDLTVSVGRTLYNMESVEVGPWIPAMILSLLMLS